MSMPEGDLAKGRAENVSSPALFEATAEPITGGARGLRRAAVAVAILGGAGAVLGLVARAGNRTRSAAGSDHPAHAAPPVPVAVAAGAMVDVPAATFHLGSTDGEPDEKPVTAVAIAAFAIDVTEVTVGAFARCVSAGKCTEPDTGMYCNWHKAGHDDHPVNCVDLRQATDYCASVDKRLPTEEEWEYAARGTDGRPYPWQDGAPAAQLCWSGDGQREGTCPVASYPAGRSPFGAYDMAGNVWEWTASGHCAYDRRGCASSARVIRGGAWNNVVAHYVRAQGRAKEIAESRRDNVGFRCARNP